MLCNVFVCVPLSMIAALCVKTFWPTEVAPPPAVAVEDRLQLWREAAAAQSLLALGVVLLLPWALGTALWRPHKKTDTPEQQMSLQEKELRHMQQQLLESYLVEKPFRRAESHGARRLASISRRFNSSLEADHMDIPEALPEGIHSAQTQLAYTKTEAGYLSSVEGGGETGATSSVFVVSPSTEVGTRKSPSPVVMTDAQTETESTSFVKAEPSAREIDTMYSLYIEKSAATSADNATSSRSSKEPPWLDNEKEGNIQSNDTPQKVVDVLLPRKLRDVISTNCISSEANGAQSKEEPSIRRHKPVKPQRKDLKHDGTFVSASGDTSDDSAVVPPLQTAVAGQKPQTLTVSLAAFPCRHEMTQIPRSSECQSLPASPKRGGGAWRGQRRVTCARCLSSRPQTATSSDAPARAAPATATIVSTGGRPLTSPRSEGHPTPRPAAHQPPGRQPAQHQHPTRRAVMSAPSSQWCPRTRQCNLRKGKVGE